jgi:hypothetical protein
MATRGDLHKFCDLLFMQEGVKGGKGNPENRIDKVIRNLPWKNN